MSDRKSSGKFLLVTVFDRERYVCYPADRQRDRIHNIAVHFRWTSLRPLKKDNDKYPPLSYAVFSSECLIQFKTPCRELFQWEPRHSTNY